MIEQIISKTTGFKFIKEHRFHPVRKWRFDFACLEKRVAVEIAGGVFSGGRHTRGVGYINDMEKYNTAVELGWKILRYTPDQIKKTKHLDQIKRVTNGF